MSRFFSHIFFVSISFFLFQLEPRPASIFRICSLRLCRYAFRSRHGLRWERLEGDRDFYPAKDSHTICDRIFTTRRHVSNVPLSPPALPTTTASQAKAQANQAPDSQLQSLMGTNKLILVHYSLPILPHLQDDGTWKIEWNEESILARSDQSVADCVTTYWFGLVTANAFDKCNSRQVLRHHGVRFISYTEKGVCTS